MTQVQTLPKSTQGAGWLYKFMGVLQGLTGLYLVAVALWLIISLPLWWPSAPRLSLPLSVDLFQSEEMISLTADNTAIHDFIAWKAFHGELSTKFAGAWDQWIYLLILGVGKIITYLFIRELRKIVGSVAQGQAFSQTNANRLRTLAILIFSTTLYESIVIAGFCRWALGSFVYLGKGIAATGFMDIFDMDQILIIWVLFVLSEVFRRGAVITKEQSLTI